MVKYTKKNTKKLIWQYILGAYGAFYALLPHSIHQVYSPDWFIAMRSGAEGFPHVIHVVLGVTMLGIFYWITYVRKD